MLGPMAQQSSRPHFSPGQASGDAAAQAFRDLAATVAEIEAHYIGEGRGMHTPEERAAGRYLVANALQHGFQCWFDPGVPNWIDAAGLPTGMIFWRFLLPEENVPPIETELVDVTSVAHST